MDATFVIGEHSFLHLGSRNEDHSSAVMDFVDLLDVAREQGEVLAWEEVFSAPVDGFDALSDFLFGPEATLDRDLRLLLGSQLQRAAPWGDNEGDPPYNLIGEVESLDFAPSVGLCWMHAASQPWAVLCVAGGPFSGECDLREAGGAAEPSALWFIEEVKVLRDFWRDSFVRYRAIPEDVRDAAGYAFPATVFAPDVWSQVKNFEGAWSEVREPLISVLAGLDDGMVKIFDEVSQNHERIALMSAHHGVDCSPESPQTHRNAAAMRQREARFADGVRTCEWHAKLEPHRNRVHYCVEDGTVYVGIFARHLL